MLDLLDVISKNDQTYVELRHNQKTNKSISAGFSFHKGWSPIQSSFVLQVIAAIGCIVKLTVVARDT